MGVSGWLPNIARFQRLQYGQDVEKDAHLMAGRKRLFRFPDGL
jgi:hypothetical protein